MATLSVIIKKKEEKKEGKKGGKDLKNETYTFLI